MLHELLLALLGNSGSLFVEKEDFRLEIKSESSYHPSEVSIIYKLLQLGSLYKKIKLFCDTYANVSLSKKNSGGLYLASFAGALREALQRYPNAVNDLECRLLDNPHMSLTDLNLALDPIKPMLTSISALITKIEHRRVRGCSILEAIHKHTSASVEQTKEIMVSVEQQVMGVLYEQLRRWLVHADLLDPHKEFFIQIDKTDDHPHVAAQTDAHDPMVSYHLVPELLPEHIPLHTAEKILFIGESIKVFEQKGKTIDDYVELCGNGEDKSVLKHSEKEILDALQDLAEKEAFCIHHFTQAIENIRHLVSQHLLSLVLEAGFVSELSDLRAVFLLERGELYQAFLPLATPLLSVPHNAIHAAQLNRLFQLAGQQVLLEESLMKKFSLNYRPPDKSQKASNGANGAWRGLRLQYKVCWPLHKMFTTAVQDKYNAVFSFLLDVRRAQQRLQQLWIYRMADKKVRMSEAESVLWTLRHQMNLLVDNIQYYLQVDVLASESSVLLDVVSNAKDYQQLETAHQAFTAAITHQCFLNNKIVSKCLNNLLSLVHDFCNVIESLNISGRSSLTGNEHSQTSQTLNEAQASKVSEINSEFEVVAAQLFWVLSLQRSKHTTQLIMRIDYNKYYTKNTQAKKLMGALTED